MTLRDLGRSLFPRPRGPMRWTDAWPVAAFALAAALVLGVLLARDVVMFARPHAFWWLLAAPWIWWMHLQGWSGLSRMRSLMALFSRLALLLLFASLLAEPRAVRTKDALAVVFALDVSESIGLESRERAAEFVAGAVTSKPQADSVGLVTFGKNAAVEVPARPTFPLEGGQIVFNARIAPDQTNLEQALSLSAALLPEDTRGRIVLVTDGSETTGTLAPVLEELKSREIAVDVLPISYSYEQEVWIERLELPQSVKLGEAYEASVVVSSLKSGTGKLQLIENGEPLGEPLPIEFQAGKNRYDLPIRLRTAGYYEYRANLIADNQQDHITDNNAAVSYIFVEGEGKVLVVTDPFGSAAEAQSLTQALQAAKRAVETTTGIEFPRDPLSLMPYDCIVFCNVPHDVFDADQTQALHDAVYNQGLGFLMVGGANSFGPGGYHRTLVETMLPVDMDITKKKILPKGALAIILHTCEFPEGNTWAKRITKQAIKVLGAQDEVGVIDFEAREQWVFELTSSGKYDELALKINAAEPGDMPAFAPTMELGLKALKKSDAATKHMIIISDGDPQPPSPRLIEDFLKAQISISTIAIFPHGGETIAVLREIANATGGRYYFPDDPNKLPGIFIKEAKTLKRTMLQNRTVDVEVGHPSPVLTGVTAIPQLDGYVLSSLKESPLVENVLFTAPDGDDPGDADPILALWRYGLGTTAAFTSDFTAGWGKHWLGWEQYEAFVKQLIIRISRTRRDGHLRLWSHAAGSEGVIMVEDFHPEEQFLDVVAQIAGPGGQQRTAPLKQVAPRRYQASFPTWGVGLYQINVRGRSGTVRNDLVNGGFIVAYSPEYLKFTSNWDSIDRIASLTGGLILTERTTPQELYNRRKPKQSTQPIFDWLLWLVAALVTLDVGLRRVQLDWSVIRGWFRKSRTEESTATMGALLARKQAVGAQLKTRREGSPPPVVSAASGAGAGARTAARTPAPVRPKETASPKAAAPQETTTTSRLLEMKRRRQGDEGQGRPGA